MTAVSVSGGSGGAGSEYYRYDSCGYLTSQQVGRQRISGDTDLYQRGHRLKRAGNTEYDAAGRMISRTKQRDGYRPEREQFRWDSRDQLTGYSRESGGKTEQWAYRYDGSGRRTEKRCDRKGIFITYLWDGDSIAEIREYRDDKLYSVRHLVFDGFELLSQQYGKERQAHPVEPVRWTMRTAHAVSEQTGRPVMLFNSAGEVVRRARDVTLWGLEIAVTAADGEFPRRREDEDADPGLLYAGQWRDGESGLCYNRFRYYEPESGMYLVSDPLGLNGGINLYSYVKNPLTWIDPLGLAGCNAQQRRNISDLRNGKDVTVRSVDEARALLDNMPDLRPHVDSFPARSGELYSGTKFSDVWKQPAGTYRGDLYNVKNPLSDVVHNSKNPLHDNNPHYNIIFGDGTKAGIIIVP